LSPVKEIKTIIEGKVNPKTEPYKKNERQNKQSRKIQKVGILDRINSSRM